MSSIVCHRRVGMTLVELLVVITILGVLALAVLPTFANSSDARRTREAARTVSSYIAKAQSRAIGRTEWAGFWLVPPTTNLTASFALDLFLADVPQVFRGDLLSTVVSGSFNSSVGFAIATGSLYGSTVSGTSGDLVRFDDKGPWFNCATANLVTLRSDVNQTVLNTAWPTAAPTTHTFELLRQPIRAGSPLSLADGRCVDTYWSGQGNASSYMWFGASPGNVAVLFDGTGRLRQLIANSSRISINGPVFLLIGRSDRAGQSYASLSSTDDSLGANWQYGDSFWIAIDPLTGVAKVAECTPGATDPVTSQTYIRSDILATGR